MAGIELYRRHPEGVSEADLDATIRQLYSDPEWYEQKVKTK